MKRFSFLVALLFLMAGCASKPATPNPAEVAATMFADKVNADATQAKFNSILEITAQVKNATATQEQHFVQATGTMQAVVYAQATAAQERADANATAEQRRADAQATQARIDADATQAQARRDAEATAQQSRADAQSTLQASGTQTAFVITQTAIPPANTNTAIAIQQSIELANNQVQLSDLAVEQQRQKNTPEWVVPFLIAVALTVAGVIYVIRYSRIREVKNDDGEIRMVLLDSRRVIVPQLMPGPIVTIEKDEITMPLLTAPSEQAKVTERAQAVEAIRSMPVHTTPQAASTFNKYFGNQTQNLPFEIIDAEGTPPAGLLDGETLKAIEKDWKEAKGE